MAIATLADHAAVLAAGYAYVLNEPGAGAVAPYEVSYQKWLTGGGGSGFLMRADGAGSTEDAAKTAAVAALNAQRSKRYDEAKDARGVSLTTDVS